MHSFETAISSRLNEAFFFNFLEPIKRTQITIIIITLKESIREWCNEPTIIKLIKNEQFP